MKFTFILSEKAQFPVAFMCRHLGVSTSGFYAWRTRAQSDHDVEDDRLRPMVHAAHLAGRKYYGSPRVHRALRNQNVRISRKRVIRLMREEELVGRHYRRFRSTTDSDHGMPVAGNLLDREFTASKPNVRWVGDTTELAIPNGRLFLAVIIDLFSRFVVGWALSAVNDRHVTLKALDMALRRRCPSSGLLHHSDQGSTYASEDYQDVLTEHGITCSMSRRGNCYDNAAMESWNSTVKCELGERFENPGDAKAKLFDYIEIFYNQTRLHSTIDYVSPAQFERAGRAAKNAALPPGNTGLSTGFESPPGPPSIHTQPTGGPDASTLTTATITN